MTFPDATTPSGMKNQLSNHLEPFITTRDTVPSYWMLDSLWSVLAPAEATGGALTVLDQTMPYRSGPPPHVHDRLHEYFYLLDGEIRFQIGNKVLPVGPGRMVSIPAGTVHAFAVSSGTARVLNIYTPGGFTEQISYLGTPTPHIRLPRPEEQTPVSAERWNAYLTRSAEINTQRPLLPGEGDDLLADERDPFISP